MVRETLDVLGNVLAVPIIMNYYVILKTISTDAIQIRFASSRHLLEALLTLAKFRVCFFPQV